MKKIKLNTAVILKLISWSFFYLSIISLSTAIINTLSHKPFNNDLLLTYIFLGLGMTFTHEMNQRKKRSEISNRNHQTEDNNSNSQA